MHIANAVDATYRGDLKEVNELNFARFDAKLEQRVSTLEAKLDQGLFGLNSKLDSKIDRVAAEIEAKLERRIGEQSRWLFAAWASLLIPIIGLWIRPR